MTKIRSDNGKVTNRGNFIEITYDRDKGGRWEL